MKETINHWKGFFNREWKRIVAVGLVSFMILLMLLDITANLNMPMEYKIYFMIIPAIVALIIKIFCIKEKEGKGLVEIYLGCWVSIVEYLGLLLIDKTTFDVKTKIICYILTVSYMFIYVFEQKKVKEVINELDTTEPNKKIFSLYYINTEKVYEIAMLLNNKIVTSGSNENETETFAQRQNNIGINANLDYLAMVKGEMGISKNTQSHNSVKNKVLENFDVKTTKSNMLASIIAKAKTFDLTSELNRGDLVLLKDATLELLNEGESYAVTKMLLNGAFKDTKLSSDNDDMKIEFDLSAMINSLLKDCVYELGCTVNNEKFLLTIPMTFENDFENSYNIYDLQIGTVTIVGIYRGEKQFKNRFSLQEFFVDNEKKSSNTYDNGEPTLKSSTKVEDNVHHENNNLYIKSNKYETVIDVIAVIQEINSK